MNDHEGKRNQGAAAASQMTNNAGGNPSMLYSFFAISETFSSSVYVKWLMIAFLPVLILLKYPVDIVDNDLWWQLAHGKYYLTHHTLKMDPSVFSWTPTDPTWIYNTCLGSIAVYLFYSFMGGFGLWLFQWLIFGGIFLAFYLFLRLLNRRLDITGVTVIAAIGIACYISCSYYKPELFSALLFSWIAFIYFYVRIKRKKYLLYLYPLIFAFWVNLHGAFLAGLVFLALAFAGEILNRIFFPGESFTVNELVHFGGACILSVAATLLNPYGVDYPISLFPTVMSSIGFKSYAGEYGWLIANYVLANASLWPSLTEMGANYFSLSFSAWIMTLMILIIIGLAVYELIGKRSCDIAVLIISAALYWKGMETGRSSYFFSIIFFFVFFYYLTYRLKLEKFYGRTAVFFAAVFIFFFISIFWFTLRYNTHRNWFGQGIEEFAPVKEVAFLKKYKPDGLIFNDYAVGGYLIWALYPDYKVFIDPRGGLYRNQVFHDYFAFNSNPISSDDIRRFTGRYPFRIVIINYRAMSTILSFLREKDEWRLLYFEKNAVVLIHKSLLPSINAKVRKENHDPGSLFNALINPVRFQDVRNPEILYNVFNIYIRINPAAGKYIRNIFKNNISDCYKPKEEFLKFMDRDIKSREQVNDNDSPYQQSWR
jgi:hypothetical protein